MRISLVLASYKVRSPSMLRTKEIDRHHTTKEGGSGTIHVGVRILLYRIECLWELAEPHRQDVILWN